MQTHVPLVLEYVVHVSRFNARHQIKFATQPLNKSTYVLKNCALRNFSNLGVKYNFWGENHPTSGWLSLKSTSSSLTEIISYLFSYCGLWKFIR